MRFIPDGRQPPEGNRVEVLEAEDAFRHAGATHQPGKATPMLPRPHGLHRRRLVLVAVCLLVLGLVLGLAVLLREGQGTVAPGQCPTGSRRRSEACPHPRAGTASPAIGEPDFSQGELLTLVQALARSGNHRRDNGTVPGGPAGDRRRTQCGDFVEGGGGGSRPRGDHKGQDACPEGSNGSLDAGLMRRAGLCRIHAKTQAHRCGYRHGRPGSDRKPAEDKPCAALCQP